MLDKIRSLFRVGETKEVSFTDAFRRFFLLWFPSAIGVSFLFLIMILAGYVVAGVVVGAVGFMLYFIAFQNWRYRITMDAQGKIWFSPCIISITPECSLRLDLCLKPSATGMMLVTSPLSKKSRME